MKTLLQFSLCVICICGGANAEKAQSPFVEFQWDEIASEIRNKVDPKADTPLKVLAAAERALFFLGLENDRLGVAQLMITLRAIDGPLTFPCPAQKSVHNTRKQRVNVEFRGPLPEELLGQFYLRLSQCRPSMLTARAPVPENPARHATAHLERAFPIRRTKRARTLYNRTVETLSAAHGGATVAPEIDVGVFAVTQIIPAAQVETGDLAELCGAVHLAPANCEDRANAGGEKINLQLAVLSVPLAVEDNLDLAALVDAVDHTRRHLAMNPPILKNVIASTLSIARARVDSAARPSTNAKACDLYHEPGDIDMKPALQNTADKSTMGWISPFVEHHIWCRRGEAPSAPSLQIVDPGAEHIYRALGYDNHSDLLQGLQNPSQTGAIEDGAPLTWRQARRLGALFNEQFTASIVASENTIHCKIEKGALTPSKECEGAFEDEPPQENNEEKSWRRAGHALHVSSVAAAMMTNTLALHGDDDLQITLADDALIMEEKSLNALFGNRSAPVDVVNFSLASPDRCKAERPSLTSLPWTFIAKQKEHEAGDHADKHADFPPLAVISAPIACPENTSAPGYLEQILGVSDDPTTAFPCGSPIAALVCAGRYRYAIAVAPLRLDRRDVGKQSILSEGEEEYGLNPSVPWLAAPGGDVEGWDIVSYKRKSSGDEPSYVRGVKEDAIRSGSSQAAPMIAALAARVQARFSPEPSPRKIRQSGKKPVLARKDIKTWLFATATPLRDIDDAPPSLIGIADVTRALLSRPGRSNIWARDEMDVHRPLDCALQKEALEKQFTKCEGQSLMAIVDFVTVDPEVSEYLTITSANRRRLLAVTSARQQQGEDQKQPPIFAIIAKERDDPQGAPSSNPEVIIERRELNPDQISCALHAESNSPCFSRNGRPLLFSNNVGGRWEWRIASIVGVEENDWRYKDRVQ